MRISDWSSDVCSSDLLEGDDDTRAVILVEWRRLGEAPRPFRVLDRAHLAPEAHGVRPRRALRRVARLVEIGRASCRERVCQYVLISVVSVSFTKQTISLSYNTCRLVLHSTQR